MSIPKKFNPNKLDTKQDLFPNKKQKQEVPIKNLPPKMSPQEILRNCDPKKKDCK